MCRPVMRGEFVPCFRGWCACGFEIVSANWDVGRRVKLRLGAGGEVIRWIRRVSWSEKVEVDGDGGQEGVGDECAQLI